MISGGPASSEQLGAILLAAGSSSRLGRPKQLVEIDGEPLVVSRAKALLSLQPARVVVVTGSEPSMVADALSGLPVNIVHNPDWARGMGSSLACGIRAMPERVRAALVLLCDQWKVQAPDLSALAEAWAEQPGAAVVSGYNEATGPPAVLPRALFDRLARLKGDVGASRVLRRWPGEIRILEMVRAAADIDEEGDLPV